MEYLAARRAVTSELILSDQLVTFVDADAAKTGWKLGWTEAM